MNEPKKPICKTKKGKETDGIGFDAEVLVKEKLWRYGYRVRHITVPYDLLVNDRIRVEVKTGKYRVSRRGISYWNIMLPKHEDYYDILAVVLPQPISGPLFLFYTINEVKKLFGDKDGISISASSRSSSRERLRVGTKSVKKVFGNTKLTN